MIAINLLNWRSRHMLILNRRFIVTVSACALVTLLFAGIIYSIFHLQTNAAKKSVAYLDAQLREVAGTISEIKKIEAKKNSILEKRKTIETLQASRPFVVEIFEMIARNIPAGVVLSQLSRKGEILSISGQSDSNYNVSIMMENAQRSPKIKSAKLTQLKTNAQGATGESVSFEIELTLNDINAGAETNAAT